MSLQKDNKLKRMLENWPDGQVGTAQWLRKYDISAQLTQRYLKSGWIIALGHGAYKKSNDQIYWFSGLAAIQAQLNKNVHIGGPTALMIRGISHFIRFGKVNIYIFHDLSEKLPAWFEEYDWDNKIYSVSTSVFPKGTGITSIEHNGFNVKASSPERAILECLYLAPKMFDLVECYQLLESLQTLRPDLMQDLLEKCKSIKVKRLFLYMAKKASLPVWKYLEIEKINMGKGDRSIVKNGVYVSEFKISVPEEIEFYV